jgi:DNA-binding PadR family transcriptional regulator
MGDKAFLGEFEHMVLAAVLRLGDAAYGAAIVKEIEQQTGRGVSGGSLYVTLDRLEDKGMVTSRMADRSPRRGGRPKRFVTVTPKGMKALRAAREAMLSLWSGIEKTLEQA